MAQPAASKAPGENAENNFKIPCNKTKVLRGHAGPVMVVKLNSDGEYCLTGAQDRMVKLWNPHRGMMIKTYQGHGQEILDIDVSKDNSVYVHGLLYRMASCGGDRYALVWDVATGSPTKKLQGHLSRINAIVLSQDGAICCTGSYDSTIRFWDLRARNKESVQTLEQFNDSVTSLVMGDAEIIAGCVDGTVRTFDIRTGKILTDNINHPVTHVALSSDAKCVLASTLDSTLRLLDHQTGECLTAFTGHDNQSYSIGACFSPSGKTVLSGSEDGRVLAWDVMTGKVIGDHQCHKSTVTSVVLHPKEPCMLTASMDGSAVLWT